MTKKQIAQMELFRADVSWFHIFKELIRSHTWAKMSSNAKALYPVIKAFTNWSDGRSFPSFDTLQEYSGLARASVSSALKELEELGFIKTKKQPGKQTLYTLVEKFEIEDAEGRPVAAASFDYLPSVVKDAVAELRNFVAQGKTPEGGLQFIHIENLTLNIAGRDQTNIQTQNNITDPMALLRGFQDRLEGKATPEAEMVERVVLEHEQGNKKGK